MKIEKIGKYKYVGFETDTHYYLGYDGQIQHNSGKSYELVSEAINHCLGKSIDGKAKQCVIIGMTLQKTVNIYWQNIITLLDSLSISYKKNNSDYTITFDNGNVLFLYGNNSKAEREKLRGFDISMCIIDECQSQQGLLYLLDSIINPMLKGRNGNLCLAGTAPLISGSAWETFINDDTFSHFHATMEDNTTIPNYEHALEEVLRENHWDKDNIIFRREYLGEIAYDTERLIIPKCDYYNSLDNLTFKAVYIGIDFGWTNATSISTIGITPDNTFYLIDCFDKQHMTSSAIKETVKQKIEKAHIYSNVVKAYCDTNEQNISRELYMEGCHELSETNKKNKLNQISELQDVCSSGQLLIPKDCMFDKDIKSYSWKVDNELNQIVYGEIDESATSDGRHHDSIDSVRYAISNILSDISNRVLK